MYILSVSVYGTRAVRLVFILESRETAGKHRSMLTEKHYVLGTYKYKEDAVKTRKDAEARFHVYSADSVTEGGLE